MDDDGSMTTDKLACPPAGPAADGPAVPAGTVRMIAVEEAGDMRFPFVCLNIVSFLTILFCLGEKPKGSEIILLVAILYLWPLMENWPFPGRRSQPLRMDETGLHRGNRHVLWSEIVSVRRGLMYKLLVRTRDGQTIALPEHPEVYRQVLPELIRRQPNASIDAGVIRDMRRSTGAGPAPIIRGLIFAAGAAVVACFPLLRSLEMIDSLWPMAIPVLLVVYARGHSRYLPRDEQAFINSVASLPILQVLFLLGMIPGFHHPEAMRLGHAWNALSAGSAVLLLGAAVVVAQTCRLRLWFQAVTVVVLLTVILVVGCLAPV